MTCTKLQREGRRPQPATVVTRMSRRDSTRIKIGRKTPTSEIRPDVMKRDTASTYLTTRSQTKTRRSSHRQTEVSRLVKTTKPKSDSTAVKQTNKINQKNAHKFTEKKVDTVQENEPNISKKAQRMFNEAETSCVQETSVSKEGIKIETVKEQNVARPGEGSTNQERVEEPDMFKVIPQTPRPARGSKQDYAQLAGIKRRSLPSPELPRFARKARRHNARARKRTRDLSEKQDSAEDPPSPTEPRASCEQLIPQNTRVQLDDGEKATIEQPRKIVKNTFLERDSQQKTRRGLLRNGSTSKSAEASETIVDVSPKAKKTDVVESHKVYETRARAVKSPTAKEREDDVEKSSEIEVEASCELDYYVTETQTSPEFVKYFHETRSRPQPDPDVYNWPKEWLPQPDTPLVTANTSALEIDPPVIKPPRHVFENTFYLQSPPKMRSEMEPWKFNFDYNPEVEKARSKKIKETERQLLSQTASGRRRTKVEKLAVKLEARRIVDTEEYLEKLTRYNDRKERDMEIMRGVYKERGLGEPLDTDDIAKMAMDIKRRVYLKSMKIAYPEHILVEEDEVDTENVNLDFTVPQEDTITDEAKENTNKTLQASEVDLERNLGVVFNEAETRPGLDVNYIYESYKMERNRKLDHSYNGNQNQDAVGGENTAFKPPSTTSDPTKRMTLWYGHEKHRKLEQYKKQKYPELMADCSSSSCRYSYDAKDTQDHRSTVSVTDGQDNYGDVNVVTMSYYSEREKTDNDGDWDCDTQEMEFEEDNLSQCDSEMEEEEFEEKAVSQPRLTLWYGHGHNKGDDEDEAINMMCGGSQTMKFDDNGSVEEIEDEFYKSQRRSTLWCGQDEVIETEVHVADCRRGTKRKHVELEPENDDESVAEEDGADEELTFTRTVPFLHLTTEDLPLRVQTQAYKFKRISRDIESPDVQINR